MAAAPKRESVKQNFKNIDTERTVTVDFDTIETMEELIAALNRFDDYRPDTPVAFLANGNRVRGVLALKYAGCTKLSYTRNMALVAETR
jgi:hypothetical protein